MILLLIHYNLIPYCLHTFQLEYYHIFRRKQIYTSLLAAEVHYTNILISPIPPARNNLEQPARMTSHA